MTIPELNQEIFTIIKDSAEADAEITTATHLFAELGLSSVEVMMLISDLEDAFGIRIPASALRSVQTAGDLCSVVLKLLQKG